MKGRSEIANKTGENETVIFLSGARSALFFAIRAFVSDGRDKKTAIYRRMVSTSESSPPANTYTPPYKLILSQG